MKSHMRVFSLTLTILIYFQLGLTAQSRVNSPDSLSRDNDKVTLRIRLGQEGFRDARSPIGKLGGGQITLDVKPGSVPVALSISNEYYTNSADPMHNYEISRLIAVNLLYIHKVLQKDRTDVFVGGGIVTLEVPEGEDKPENGIGFDFEAGVHYRIFWKMGLYGIYKFLYANKTEHHIKVIEFNEHIILLGVTVNFVL